MKNIKVIIGAIIVVVSILSMKDYVLIDDKWSDYQKGIVIGKFLLFCIGIFLIYPELRRKKIHGNV